MLNKKISIIMCMLLSSAICVLSGCSGASDTDSLSTSEPSSVESVSAQSSFSSTADESEVSEISEEVQSSAESSDESSSDTPSAAEESSEIPESSAGESYAEPEESFNEPEDVSIDEKPSAENTAWKQAYIDYINENGRKTDTLSGGYIEFYKLVDINGDEIPELYINYGSTATGDEICSYYNDTVIKQHIYNFGFSYIEGQNLFCDSGGHMDRYYDKVYTIENGTFKLLCDGEYGAENNARVQLDENGRPIYFYKFNGDDVSTKDEHEGLLKSVYDKDKARNPAREAEYNSADHRYEGEGICYYDEIIEAINKY